MIWTVRCLWCLWCLCTSEDISSLVQTGLHTLTHGGFHRLDEAFGRELVEASQLSRLSLAEVVVAARFLRRYRHTLITLPDEASIINWAIEQQDESISEEEITLPSVTERVDVEAQENKKEQTAIECMYVRDDRIIVRVSI